eukprot:312721_1
MHKQQSIEFQIHVSNPPPITSNTISLNDTTTTRLQFEEQKEIESKTKPPTNTNTNNKAFQLKHIHYRLNEEENEIIVKEFDESPLNHSPTKIRAYCQYIDDYMMDHRIQRYYIVFAPIYIIFIIFCAYVCLFISDGMNRNVISYLDNPPNIVMRNSYAVLLLICFILTFTHLFVVN